MTAYLCAFPECLYPAASYGWCAGHYEQASTTGSLTALPAHHPAVLAPPDPDLAAQAPEPAAPRRRSGRRYGSLHEKFQAQVRPGPSCWGWEGTRYRNGNPYVVQDGERVSANRYAWEWVNGPLPATARLINPTDCHCVNPGHYRLAGESDTPVLEGLA